MAFAEAANDRIASKAMAIFHSFSFLKLVVISTLGMGYPPEYDGSGGRWGRFHIRSKLRRKLLMTASSRHFS